MYVPLDIEPCFCSIFSVKDAYNGIVNVLRNPARIVVYVAILRGSHEFIRRCGEFLGVAEIGKRLDIVV